MHSWLHSLVLVSVTLGSGGQKFDPREFAPTVTARTAGIGKVGLDITAAPTGAPQGFKVLWMTESAFQANGSRWYTTPNPNQGEAEFTKTALVNSWGAPADFRLSPSERVTVEIGDLLDETDVQTNWRDELAPDTRYVFTAIALGVPRRVGASDPAVAPVKATKPEDTCVFTRKYWRDHPTQWPVSTMVLGNRLYTKLQLLSILQQPSTSNGLVILARQLITTKLNVANGANPASVQTAIDAADARIGFLRIPPTGTDTLAPILVRDLTQTMDDFNHGMSPGNPCIPTSVVRTSWGSVKAAYR